jgi:dUTP pyrophosphatase
MKNSVDPNLLNQIQSQFESLKTQMGIEPDEESLKGLDTLFGNISFDEIQREMETAMKTKTIKIETIHEDAIFPGYAYPSDSGFDLYSVEELEMTPLSRALVSTGLKVSFDEGYEIQVRPKSGLAINYGITCLNTPGTVDQGYTGEIKVILFNTSNETFTVKKGMKIAQAVLCPVMNGKFVNLELVESIDNKDRGNNGFGSTGI